MSVEMTRYDELGLITMNNPPVNAMSHATRRACLEALQEAEADPSLKGVMITGGSRAFIAGADIKEFNTPAVTASPTLGELIAYLDAMETPTAALIAGAALGGGLEVAMACRLRYANASSKLGLPEIKLGLIPGAGGTQRLPRLIQLERAIELVTSGDPISGGEAHELGLIDGVANHEDFLNDGLALFRARLKREEGGGVPVSARDICHADDAQNIFATYQKKAKRQRRSVQAYGAALEALQSSVSSPFELGLKKERALFEHCVATPASKALRYLFFAERSSGKLPADVPKPVALKKIGIVGAGTMGIGITQAAASCGYEVILVDKDDVALKKAAQRLEDSFSSAVKKGKIAESAAKEALAAIAYGQQLEALADCDLVIEAVYENLSLKQGIFKSLDAICDQKTILATNTSYLDVEAIGSATSRPDRVIGLHFFNPAHIMLLLEVIETSATSPATLSTIMGVARTLNKIPVIAGNDFGFIGNRMLTAYRDAANALVLQGASPHQVDKALEGYGFAMGPFAVSDLAGLDVSWRMRKERAEAGHTDAFKKSALPDALCELGRYGRKSGIGYYRYDLDTGRPVDDQESLAVIIRLADEAGIQRRDISTEEILDECLKVLSQEGEKILPEGIAKRPEDIDIVWTRGYGFPADKGGPMYAVEYNTSSERQ